MTQTAHFMGCFLNWQDAHKMNRTIVCFVNIASGLREKNDRLRSKAPLLPYFVIQYRQQKRKRPAASAMAGTFLMK